MSIYKRGEIYWYSFILDGERIQESSRQGNQQVARDMEAAHRTRLVKERDERRAKAEQFGCPLLRVIRCAECEKWFDSDHAVTSPDGKRLCSDHCRAAWQKKTLPVPTLREFINKRVDPWAKATFEHSSPKTWCGWYRPNLRIISEYKALADRPIPQITTEHIADFAAQRRAKGLKGKALQVSSVNATLRVLRRVLRLAVEWGLVPSAPKIKMVRGEKHRERVISPEDEAKYLAAAPEPLASVATVLCDTGLRPEECYRLRWEAMNWASGRHGTLLVTHGKTAAARRVLPMTPRVRAVLETRWEHAGKPQEGFVFTAPTQSGHIEPSTLKKQHRRTFETANAGAKATRQPELTPWVLYSFRHTFLTRLGESGCDAWTLARIAGHNSIAISARYVHPSENAVLSAFSRVHNGEALASNNSKQLPEPRQ